MSTEIQKRKKGQILNTNERQLILNLMNYLKGKNSGRSISEVIREISNATGCSERTIYKIKKEASTGVVVTNNKPRVRKKENKNSRNVKYDSYVKSSIRKKVHNYLLQNIPPTLNSILCLVNGDPELPNFKRSTLHTLLKEIGFTYVQKGKKSLLTESCELVKTRQQYLKDIKRLRGENRLIVYTGETLVSLMKKNFKEGDKQCSDNGNNIVTLTTVPCSTSITTNDSVIHDVMPCNNLLDTTDLNYDQTVKKSNGVESIELLNHASSISNSTDLSSNSDLITNQFSSGDINTSTLSCSIDIDIDGNMSITNSANIIHNAELTLNSSINSTVHDIGCNTDNIPIHSIIEDGSYLLGETSETKEQEQQTEDISNDVKDEQNDTKNSNSRELRFSILLAGCDNGFVQGTEHVLLCKKKTEEANCYEHWFTEKLLPKIPPKSVIVIDNNAPYHRKREENIPDSTWKKQQIKNWLLSNNINVDDMTQKKDLLAVVNDVRSSFSTKHKIDEIAKQHGIIILSLPPFHYELNPLNLVWAQVKCYVKSNLKSFKIKKIKQLIKDSFYSINQLNWMNFIYHVRQVEDVLCTVGEIQESNQAATSDSFKEVSSDQNLKKEFFVS